MRNKMDYYVASDYAGAEVGHHKFYYGYEHTVCEHGKDSKDCNCDKDWCFIAEYCGLELMRYTCRQMKIARHDIVDGLVKGMLAYIEKYAVVKYGETE